MRTMSEPATSGSVVLAALVALAMVVGLFLVRRWMFDGLPERGARSTERRVPAGEAAKAGGPPVAAPSPKKAVDVERVAAVIDGFDVLALGAEVRAWFVAAQRARLEAPPAELAARFLPGAADVAFARAEGLERVGDVVVTTTALRRAGGSADGCEVHFLIEALVDEDRRGKRDLVEVSELWALGYPPARSAWQVIRVDRRWRRSLEAPRAAPAAVELASKAVVAPTLDADLARLELTREEVEAVARDALARWVDALDHADPGRLGAASPAMVDQVTGAVHRHAWFDHRLAWSVEAASFEVARAQRDARSTIVTVRAMGEATAVVAGPDGAERERWSGPWARYLDLARTEGGAWRFVGACDDDAWVA